MGKTWDEGPYVEIGYHYVELALAGKFSDPFWYLQADHPPLARYVYGLASIPDIKNIAKDGTVFFHYNYTFPRIVSAIIGSLTVVFIILLGTKYFNNFIAISSGVIFALIPFFVGLSQLATLESFTMFFFTGAIYFFLEFLDRKKQKMALLAGVFSGLAILVKQSNILVLPLIFSLVILHFFYQRRSYKELKVKIISLLIVGLASVLTFIALWPMPLFNMAATWGVQQTMWVDAVKLPPPERFAGVLILVPWPYYFFMFFATTPLALIVLSLIGALKIDRNRKFIGIAIIVWFLFSFIQTLYPFKQHGLRYIIQIYAPFSLLCGIGISYLGEWFTNFKYYKPLSLLAVSAYLVLVLLKIQPYYLDYFSETVGGNNNVYQKRLFQMGWWGQGIGEAAFFINEREKREVTVAVAGGQPAGVMPKLKKIKVVYYTKDTDADYVIVPYFDVVRLWFPEYELVGRYKEIHSVMVDKAKLVKIYERADR